MSGAIMTSTPTAFAARPLLPRVLHALLFLLLLQSEPGLFATNFGAIHLLLCVAVFGVIVYVEHASLPQVLLGSFRRPEFTVLIAYFLIIFLNDFIRSPHLSLVSAGFLLKAVVGLLSIMLLSQLANRRELLTILIWACALQAGSYCVFYALFAVGAHEALFAGAFKVEAYSGEQRWYLPISTFYQQVYQVGGVILFRATGLFREPGAFQAIAAAAFAAAVLLRRPVLALLILADLAFSLSSAALLSLLSLLAYFIVIKSRQQRASGLLVIAGIITVLVALAPFFYNFEAVGFKEKIAGESGQDRVVNARLGTEVLMDNPFFGIGMFNDDRYDSGLHGHNLIAGVGVIGLVGLALMILSIALAARRLHTLASFAIYLPLLVTMITSQPLYYGVIPLVFLLLPLPLRQASSSMSASVNKPGNWQLRPRSMSPVPLIPPPPPPREGGEEDSVVILDER